MKVFHYECKDLILFYIVTAEHGAAVEVNNDSDPWRDDDSSVFRATDWDSSGGSFTALGGATRRFAMDCICRIIAQCETADPAHFNMALAQKRRLHQSTGRVPLQAFYFLFWLMHCTLYSLN